jgi:hypothetical protein
MTKAQILITIGIMSQATVLPRSGKWLYKDGILCLIFQSYDLTLIEEAMGTSYNGRNCLFPARGRRGQAFQVQTDFST